MPADQPPPRADALLPLPDFAVDDGERSTLAEAEAARNAAHEILWSIQHFHARTIALGDDAPGSSVSSMVFHWQQIIARRHRNPPAPGGSV